ncbi:PLDc N-terminal domain-containing protein [Bacillus sp. Bva_UNVM-123]
MLDYGFYAYIIFWFLIILIVIALPIIILVWAYKDAINNGKSSGYALGILFLILFFPILGLLIYLLIRKS